MQVSTIVLNVVLVAAGLVIYDTVRSPVPPEPDATPEVTRSEGPVPDAGPVPAALSGRGEQAWLEALDRRLAALESPGASRALEAAAAASPEEPSVDLLGLGIDEELLEEAVDGEVASSRFSPRQLRIFRSMLDAVEEERRAERAVAGVDRLLQRAEVQLTDAQRDEVVDATLAFQQKMRSMFRGGGDATTTQEARRETMQGLRKEYQEVLETILPTADADRIVQAISGAGRRGLGGGRGGRPGGQAPR